ncbi:MAG: ribulose-phosphate 3-epimerase [Oscillospiraceae bacterium]|nr:ribulose-phosphate 3-epimerase [Oscillospiraceae bacterium]
METQVSASILNADLLHLEEEVRRLENAGADMLHYDVMDGIFVPNISFGLPVMRAISDITELFMDVHLMIQRPHVYIQDFVQAGADMITFHLESESDPMETIHAIHDAGCKAGVSVKPSTPGAAVKPYLDELDNILVMTVEPGFGGQGFMHDMLDKIREIREMIVDKPITLQVDGGINAQTALLVSEAGAGLLVAGSYLFRHADLCEAVQTLRVKKEEI